MWNDFFSEYLEMIKPEYGQPIDEASYDEAIELFEKFMTVTHPFMPFVTEEIWHYLKDRKEGDDCVVSQYPKVQPYDKALIKQVDAAIEITSKARGVRKEKGMKEKEPLKLYIKKSKNVEALFKLEGLEEIIQKRGFLSEIQFVDTDEVDGTFSFIAGTDKFFLESTIVIDNDAEKEKLTKELEYAEGSVKIVEKKLNNERFVSNAPAAVVEKERKKLADGQARIKILKDSLARLN